MVVGVAEVLCRVSSLCQRLSLAPGPVPAAGTMNVAALAASGRIAIEAAVMSRLNFMKAPFACEYERVQ